MRYDDEAQTNHISKYIHAIEILNLKIEILLGKRLSWSGEFIFVSNVK